MKQKQTVQKPKNEDRQFFKLKKELGDRMYETGKASVNDLIEAATECRNCSSYISNLNKKCNG